MSSIRSASSRTKNVHLFKFVVFVSKKSKSLPGVAIKISTPSLSLRAYSPLGTPPYIARVLNLHVFENFFASTSICIANSLVGAITKTIGPSPL